MLISERVAEASAQVEILVVDDEPDIVSLVAYHLSKTGFVVHTAGNAEEALEKISAAPPALIVLDLMLPGIGGIDLLERLRSSESTREIAVLLLTARREEADRIRGLASGADDYLTKPFSPEELVLRVKAILRRVNSRVDGPDLLAVGDIVIDRLAHRVKVGAEPIDLTPTEYRLLLLLAEKRGRVHARGKLLETVWSAAPDIQTRTVDMHVQRLRAKLGKSGDLIETVRGFGYRIRADSTARREARA